MSLNKTREYNSHEDTYIYTYSSNAKRFLILLVSTLLLSLTYEKTKSRDRWSPNIHEVIIKIVENPAAKANRIVPSLFKALFKNFTPSFKNLSPRNHRIHDSRHRRVLQKEEKVEEKNWKV